MKKQELSRKIYNDKTIKTTQRKMKLLGFKHEKHYLNVEEAQNIFRFGYRNVSLEEALSKEIDYLEAIIKTKSNNNCRIVSTTYQDYKEDMVEKLAEHFKEKSFVVDIYKNPNIKGFILLIIGW